jgi:type VI secretion system secreted protein VgrG
MAKTQQNRQVAIETPLGEDVLLLAGMWGREELGRPFEFQLDLTSENQQVKFSDIVGQNVTVRLELADGSTRYFNGFISRFTQVSCGKGQSTGDHDEAQDSATMVPWLWFLTRTADCRIFQEMPVPDIIKQVFRDAGFSDFEDALTGTYRTWEYCVQYRETAFNFVSRLMEQEGIYYFFRHENGRHILVLADAPGAHKPCPGYENVSCQFSGTPVSEHEYISEWVVETRIQPGSVSLNAFDFKNTKRDLNTRASISREHNASDLDVYDYSADYTETGDGESYARRRIEELHTQYEVATATSNARGLSTGGTFTLADHPRADQNHDWLITGAGYTLTQSEFSSGEGRQECVYSCSFTAIGSTELFRSARVTPRPTIPGPQTAIVVGPSGEEVHVDEYGRVKVQFHWDRYGKADENSSCWVRVGQTWAGKQWGAIYTPRIGQEVIIEFLEGDPDHPIITGRVYNGQAMPPYDLPANKTISTLKSNSTKGGGGFNEIRFEDKKGEEQVFVHAEKNLDIRVKNDRFETVSNDRHLHVEKDKFEHVDNNRHEKVDADHKEEIGKDRHLKVAGKEAKEVGGSLSLTVKGDVIEAFKANHSEQTAQNLYLKAMGVVIEGMQGITLKCGGNSVVLDPVGVTLSGSMVTLDGKMTMINSGPGSPPASGQAGNVVAPAAITAALDADKASPGEVAETKAQQIQTKTGKYGSTPIKPHKPPKTKEEKEQKKSWIEIELLGEDDSPIPGETYRITLPDGSVVEGTLDDKGLARVDGIDPGTCQITFPNLDQDAWQKM